jgi:hypothetical protein
MSKQYFMGSVVLVHHKGGNSKAEMNRANQLQDQRNQMLSQQLQLQQNQLNMVNPSLQAIIANRGILPEQEAAMRSQATALTGQNEQQAIGNINQALVARGITGGQNAGSGDIARNYGALNSQLAAQQANLLNQIQIQKGQGLMNAIGTGLGEGQMYGQQALGFGGQALGALGSGVTAANAADQATTGFWGSVLGGLTGLGGAAIGKGGIFGKP